MSEPTEDYRLFVDPPTMDEIGPQGACDRWADAVSRDGGRPAPDPMIEIHPLEPARDGRQIMGYTVIGRAIRSAYSGTFSDASTAGEPSASS